MRYSLTEINYEKPAGIESTVYRVKADSWQEPTIIIVAFRGEYPDGSQGKRQGAYISYATMCALHAFSPQALVLDFRELHYNWGDTMLAVFQDVSQFMNAGLHEGGYPFPVVVAMSDKSAGLRSLLRPNPEEPRVFEDLDEAISAAHRYGRRWQED